MDTDTFAERMFTSLLGGFDLLSIALGDRLGLYDALHRLGPSTHEELAVATSTHPRYVLEWLEQQTVAGILEVDDAALPVEQRRFEVPAQHVPALADPDNPAYFRPFLAAVAAAAVQLPALEDAYRSGGGVSWQQFGDHMRRAQGAGNRPLFLSALGQDWLPSVPRAHEALVAGGRVADVGCGEGWSAIAIGLAYPDATVDGFDVDQESVEAATAHAATYGLGDRVRFHQVDGSLVDRPGEYDLVTAFECIHDLPDPVSVLAEMRELAAADGTVLVMDERVPDTFTGAGDSLEQMFYGFSILVCLPDGMSHPGSVGTGTVMRRDTFTRYAQAAGFREVDVLPIDNEVFRLYELVR